MCTFPSYFENKTSVAFLTDDELKANKVAYADGVGHSAVERCLKLDWRKRGMHKEEGVPGINGTMKALPAPIVKAIRNGEMTKMAKTNGITRIKLDDQGRLHCTTGSAFVSNGYYQYFVHGRRVTKEEALRAK